MTTNRGRSTGAGLRPEGRASFGGEGFGLPCAVEAAGDGAGPREIVLAFVNPPLLPDRFDLEVAPNGRAYRVELLWQEGRRARVSFVGAGENRTRAAQQGEVPSSEPSRSRAALPRATLH